jgi:hypothetical protein
MKNKILLIISVVVIVAIVLMVWIKLNKEENDIVFNGQEDGCANFLVFKINSDNTASIAVDARIDELKISNIPQTFEIGNTEGLRVELKLGKGAGAFYCTDVIPYDSEDIMPKTLLGNSGQAIISVSGYDESIPKPDRRYKATVILKDVHFIDEKGVESDVVIDELIFKDILVGFLLG